MMESYLDIHNEYILNNFLYFEFLIYLELTIYTTGYFLKNNLIHFFMIL